MAPSTLYRFDRTLLKLVPTEKKGKEVSLVPAKIPQIAGTSPESNLQEALERNIPVGRSGRTLKEILSFSCQNLKSYTINKVRPSVWGQATNVKYHLQIKTLEDLQREMELMKTQLGSLQAEHQHEMESMKTQLGSLQAEQEARKETMEKWQAANNVIQALGEIAWSQLSAKRKADLAHMADISDFMELYYNYRTSTTATTAYMSVNADIRRFVDAAIKLKKEVKGDRGHVAHPEISMACMEEVLDKLGITNTGHPGLRKTLISDLHAKV